MRARRSARRKRNGHFRPAHAGRHSRAPRVRASARRACGSAHLRAGGAERDVHAPVGALLHGVNALTQADAGDAGGHELALHERGGTVQFLACPGRDAARALAGARVPALSLQTAGKHDPRSGRAPRWPRVDAATRARARARRWRGPPCTCATGTLCTCGRRRPLCRRRLTACVRLARVRSRARLAAGQSSGRCSCRARASSGRVRRARRRGSRWCLCSTGGRLCEEP